MLIPICDILLVEHRTCKHCGSTTSAPSPVRHRLYRAPIGELDKIVITVPPADEYLAGAYADHLARKDVSIEVPHCELCWQTSIDFDELLRHRPERPQARGFGLYIGAPSAEKLSRPIPRLEDL